MKHVECGSLLTCDPEFEKVLRTAENVASSKATILISGESGTGKELLARFIHDKSPRAGRNFVAVNCAALPEGLLESELFGFEKGAFTGAVNSKAGRFELASNSTILLDEISEMPMTLQAKLLRVLQEEEVDRLGGRSPVKVNLRVLATTNRNLTQMVREGLFREDLFYRLNVIPLHIPPLRSRLVDIPLLAEHFVKVSAILNNRLPEPKLSREALAKLISWNWPGNVRELENVIERAVLLTSGIEIGTEQVIIEGEGNVNRTQGQVRPLAMVEKELILQALNYTQQNRTRAAELLGISVRTLRNKLREYRGEEVENVTNHG